MRHVFAVEGVGEFPIDMLRYDQCWPITPLDAAKIADSYQSVNTKGYARRRVALCSANHKITPERWASCGWRVVQNIQEKAG
jgi:hypothetical protein